MICDDLCLYRRTFLVLPKKCSNEILQIVLSYSLTCSKPFVKLCFCRSPSRSIRFVIRSLFSTASSFLSFSQFSAIDLCQEQCFRGSFPLPLALFVLIAFIVVLYFYIRTLRYSYYSLTSIRQFFKNVRIRLIADFRFSLCLAGWSLSGGQSNGAKNRSLVDLVDYQTDSV